MADTIITQKRRLHVLKHTRMYTYEAKQNQSSQNVSTGCKEELKDTPE